MNRPIARTSFLILVLLGLGACGGSDGSPADSGSPPADASSQQRDGSAPPVDAFVPPVDSGTDATVPPVDSGTDATEPPVDSGTDASVPPADSGTDAGVTCPTGKAGPTCQDCAAGYQDANGDGSCELGCDATGADALDCGVGGTCAVDTGTGLRGCTCGEGYVGTLCDSCASGYEMVSGSCTLNLPPSTNLSLWLDAASPASLTLGGASGEAVAAWHDRRPLDPKELSQSVASAQPHYVPTGSDGRSAVLFDGGDQLYLSGYFGLSTSDYEIIVALSPNASGTPNGILGASSGSTDWAVMLDQHADEDFRLIHRNPPGTTGGHSIIADRTLALGPEWVAATHQSSGTVDTVDIFASDGASVVSSGQDITPSSGIGTSLILRLGRTSAGFMVGEIYEVLIYTRRLSAAERSDVTDYLRAKWHLP